MKKLSVKIVTDSTAYIDRKLLKKLDITEASMIINYADRSFPEIVMTNEVFYKSLEGTEKRPTSSQPSPLTFYHAFGEKVKQGHDVLSILISSKLSGSYYSAVQAREMILKEMPEACIEIIDSHTTVMGLGLVVLSAARLAQQGLSLSEVTAETHNLLTRSKIFFIPKTLEYLKKGGRIGDAAALLGSLLQITPILTVNGVVTVSEKVRTFEKAVKKMMQTFENDCNAFGVEAIAVHHINCPLEGQGLVEELQSKTGQEVLLSPIGPVIGLHVGPGTLGLAYILRGER
ncbi:MAG: DegV family protein [Desulfitobacteriaceae bacterium]|nr:DegV family protein [Desulfitobacteriaceae bacterium]